MLFPELAIATSVAPSRLDEQRSCISTWQHVTDTIISVNSKAEAAALRPEFPAVTFREATRDGTAATGKPYVYVNDIIDALLETQKPYLAILNSDVIVTDDEAVHSEIKANVAGALIFGQRVDVTGAAERSGRFYFGGFDFFIFDRRIAGLISRTDFLMGVPWWDYWLPFELLARHSTVKQLISPFCFHVKHQQRWDEGSYKRFGQLFAAIAQRLDANHSLPPELHARLEGSLTDSDIPTLNVLVLSHLKRSGDKLYAGDAERLRRYFEDEVADVYTAWQEGTSRSARTVDDLAARIRQLSSRRFRWPRIGRPGSSPD